jgi:hypothetical protein
MPFSGGCKLSPYEILGLLSSGRMGEVIQAALNLRRTAYYKGKDCGQLCKSDITISVEQHPLQFCAKRIEIANLPRRITVPQPAPSEHAEGLLALTATRGSQNQVADDRLDIGMTLIAGWRANRAIPKPGRTGANDH